MVKMTGEKILDMLMSMSKVTSDIQSLQTLISLSFQRGDIEQDWSKQTQIAEKIYYDFRGTVTEMYKFDHEIRSKQK